MEVGGAIEIVEVGGGGPGGIPALGPTKTLPHSGGRWCRAPRIDYSKVPLCTRFSCRWICWCYYISPTLTTGGFVGFVRGSHLQTKLPT